MSHGRQCVVCGPKGIPHGLLSLGSRPFSYPVGFFGRHVPPRGFHAAGMRLEAVDPIGELLKCGFVVMADHDDLNVKCSRGTANNLHEVRDQVRMQSAVLLVEH